MSPERVDLGQLAENGLKRGFTTGSSATAAAKAALMKLLWNETPSEVEISLADSSKSLVVPIDRICVEEKGIVRADVIKDGGDDPDATHRARIFVRVKQNDLGEVRFLRGTGVGVVTQPGLQILARLLRNRLPAAGGQPVAEVARRARPTLGRPKQAADRRVARAGRNRHRPGDACDRRGGRADGTGVPGLPRVPDMLSVLTLRAGTVLSRLAEPPAHVHVCPPIGAGLQ